MEFKEGYIKKWGEDKMLSILLELLEQNITDEDGLRLRNEMFSKKITLELFRSEIFHLIRLCVKNVGVCEFDDGYLVLDRKTKKKSKRQLYMEEVIDKIERGEDFDLDNTKIDINNRDMRSIQRHLGVEPNINGTNYSKNHLEWDKVQHLFDKAKVGELTREQLIKEIRIELNHDVSITAINYKLFEMGVKCTT